MAQESAAGLPEPDREPTEFERRMARLLDDPAELQRVSEQAQQSTDARRKKWKKR